MADLRAGLAVALALVGCARSPSVELERHPADAQLGSTQKDGGASDLGPSASADASKDADAQPIDQPCRNDCDCDPSSACLGTSCTIANRNNQCCTSPYCPADALCVLPIPNDSSPLLSCSEGNANCGGVSDGVGGLLACGTCAPPETCGGGGIPSQCGRPADAGCVPLSCSGRPGSCGIMSDHCGGVIQCGDCTPPLVCGGGGVLNVCGPHGWIRCSRDAGPAD